MKAIHLDGIRIIDYTAIFPKAKMTQEQSSELRRIANECREALAARSGSCS